MITYAIKFSNNTYYAGCYKTAAKTILGAQLYKSEKTAQNVIDKSINFNNVLPYSIIKIEIKEV